MHAEQKHKKPICGTGECTHGLLVFNRVCSWQGVDKGPIFWRMQPGARGEETGVSSQSSFHCGLLLAIQILTFLCSVHRYIASAKSFLSTSHPVRLARFRFLNLWFCSPAFLFRSCFLESRRPTQLKRLKSGTWMAMTAPAPGSGSGSGGVESESSPWEMADSSSDDGSSETSVDLDMGKPANYTAVDKSFLCQILTLQHTQLEQLRRINASLSNLGEAVAQVQRMLAPKKRTKTNRTAQETSAVTTVATRVLFPCHPSRGLKVLRKMKASSSRP